MPVTTRSAELSPVVVFLVQPVGAVVCANNITVPESNAAAAAEVQVEPLDVNTLPVEPGATN